MVSVSHAVQANLTSSRLSMTPMVRIRIGAPQLGHNGRSERASEAID
jgi:hypothetical protein